MIFVLELAVEKLSQKVLFKRKQTNQAVALFILTLTEKFISNVVRNSMKYKNVDRAYINFKNCEIRNA